MENFEFILFSFSRPHHKSRIESHNIATFFYGFGSASFFSGRFLAARSFFLAHIDKQGPRHAPPPKEYLLDLGMFLLRAF